MLVHEDDIPQHSCKLGCSDMIRQLIYLPKYQWRITAYYSVSCYWTREIMEELYRLGAGEDVLKSAYRNIASCSLDTGLCFSNGSMRESLLVIAKTSSAAEFFNSFEHEFQHLKGHISTTLGFDPNGEEVAYMSGELAREIFPKIRHLLCDCCRHKKPHLS